MGILQINTELLGESGVNPRLVRIVCDDDFSTITTAGYLNPVSLQGYLIFPTDFVFMDYGNPPINHDIFIPSITNGIITLNLYTSSSGVNFIPPVVAGDFAVYANTSGDIEDNGYLASDATKTRVVMADDTVVVGNLAAFSDINGTIEDSGTAAADVVSATTPTVTGHFANFSNVNGDIEDLGFVPSDATKTNVVMIAPAGLQTNGFATFADTNGTIQFQHFPSDSGFFYVAMVEGTPVNAGNMAFFSTENGTINDLGVSPTNPAVNKLASVSGSGSIVSGNIANFSDTNGTIQDSGFPTSNIQPMNNIQCATTAFPGGAAQFSLNTPFTNIGVNSVIIATATTVTNDVPLIAVTRFDNGQLDVKFDSDPGAGSLSYVIFVNPQG